jgi:hypothetical protein
MRLDYEKSHPCAQVLLDGGYSYPPYEAQTQVYAVRSGMVTPTTAFNPLAWINTLELLPAACAVLAVGSDQSYSDASSALYSTLTGNWTLAGPLLTGRTEFNLEALPDGTALMAAGVPAASANGASGSALASAELFDPATNEWAATGALAQPRSNAESALLPGGLVLVAGGQVAPAPGAIASAELYSANSSSWSGAGAMATARVYHQMLTLQNGNALAMGGQDGLQVPPACPFSFGSAGHAPACHPVAMHGARSELQRIAITGCCCH